jgi:hypothetical protein
MATPVTTVWSGQSKDADSRLRLRHRLRRHVASDLYDASGAAAAEGFAIYSLADPSELQLLRYVGQTAAPRRRLRQHLDAARLWVPDERPWWIRDPKMRPLYEWIRSLHREHDKLPTMVVWEWVSTAAAARAAERARICAALSQGMALLNVEAERSSGQQRLF